MKRISTYSALALQFTLAIAVAPTASAQAQQPTQAEQPTRQNSIALESDVISYFLAGYSAIVNLSLRNGFQAAFGVGRYDVPSFLVEADDNYDTAQWEATVTSVQVFRAGYRFKGPMRNGPALAAVVLNQNWHLRSDPLGGETRFRTLSVGLSGGYYFHIGTHFYIYPTAAFTHNDVSSGSTSVNGTNYKIEEWGPNGSVHIGWDWRF